MEFGQCQVGGLPPPAFVPTDEQHEGMRAAGKALDEASAAQEANKQA